MTFYFECLRRSLATIPFQLMHSEIFKKNPGIQRKSYIRSSSAGQDGSTDHEMLETREKGVEKPEDEKKAGRDTGFSLLREQLPYERYQKIKS